MTCVSVRSGPKIGAPKRTEVKVAVLAPHDDVVDDHRGPFGDHARERQLLDRIRVAAPIDDGIRYAAGRRLGWMRPAPSRGCRSNILLA